MTTTQRDISLAEIDPGQIGSGEELYLMSQATNDDGTINVRIRSWDKAVVENEEIAEVSFMTPSGEIEHDQMPWPSYDSPENKFVRLCQEYGHGVVDPDGIEAKLVPATKDDDEWELSVPHERSVWEQVKPCIGIPFTLMEVLTALDILVIFLLFISVGGVVITGLAALAGYLPGLWWTFGILFCFSLAYTGFFMDAERLEE